MKLETNPNVIDALAKEREDANWKFRRFLKDSDLKTEELDAIVHRHYEEISSQIDCRECGNCCRKMPPILDATDITRLADGMGLTEEIITRQWLKPAEEPKTFQFNKTPCPLLAGNLCTAYKCRPESCRSYPHLHKEWFSGRLLGVIQNYSVCPIVFHVFERLKKELWHRPYDSERDSI